MEKGKQNHLLKKRNRIQTGITKVHFNIVLFEKFHNCIRHRKREKRENIAWVGLQLLSEVRVWKIELVRTYLWGSNSVSKYWGKGKRNHVSFQKK